MRADKPSTTAWCIVNQNSVSPPPAVADSAAVAGAAEREAARARTSRPTPCPFTPPRSTPTMHRPRRRVAVAPDAAGGEAAVERRAAAVGLAAGLATQALPPDRRRGWYSVSRPT